MKREITIVPKDKCPLDVLTELGQRTANAWIFIHQNAINKLRSTCNNVNEFYASFSLGWDACEKYPATIINISDIHTGFWHEVFKISAENIAFKQKSTEPEEIFFLKMEE